MLERYGHKPAVRDADALLLLRMLRDLVDWDAVLSYIATLPPHIAHHPQVMEHECLAMATGCPGSRRPSPLASRR